MSKHSPRIELDAARLAYDAAERNGMHWDFEGFDANEEHECCRELYDAGQRLSKARKAVRTSDKGKS